MNREIVWLGHGNTIDLVLMANGAVPSLDTVSHMTLTVGSVLLDSNVTPTAFDWSKKLTAAEAAKVPGALAGDPKLVVSLGSQTGLVAGVYDAALVVYDPTNTDGIVWDLIPLRVLADPEGTGG
jgi:hypothetical protein